MAVRTDTCASGIAWRRALGVCLLVALCVGVVACGGTQRVPLSELAIHMQRYDGQQVATRGVITEFGGEDVEPYYVIQDDKPNRVRLLPAEVAAPHVRSVVEVVGTFEFDPNRGRLLHVETIEPIAGGS